jgi:hypothetical protein
MEKNQSEYYLEKIYSLWKYAALDSDILKGLNEVMNEYEKEEKNGFTEKHNESHRKNE